MADLVAEALLADQESQNDAPLMAPLATIGELNERIWENPA
jgi:hypothetical protein